MMHAGSVRAILAGMSTFRKLNVWKKAHALALRVHAVTADLPVSQVPGVAERLRHGAADVAAAIVEGTWSDSPRQFARCLETAMACARDLDYRLLLAADLGEIARTEHVRLSARLEQICRMLAALRDTVEREGSGRRRASPGRRAPPEVS